jgi:hypothetical protein
VFRKKDNTASGLETATIGKNPHFSLFGVIENPLGPVSCHLAETGHREQKKTEKDKKGRKKDLNLVNS